MRFQIKIPTRKFIHCLKQALKIKGGKHASLITPAEVKKEISQFQASTSNVKNNILYIHLPEFSGSLSLCKMVPK